MHEKLLEITRENIVMKDKIGKRKTSDWIEGGREREIEIKTERYEER